MFVLLGLITAAAGQQTTQTYTTDVSGNRAKVDREIVQARSDSTATTTEKTVNLNGVSVALERTVERVLRQNASGKVVETLIQRYDANGQPGPLEKVVTDERKNPDGSVTTVASTYRSDLNGDLQLTEKAVTDTRRRGATTTSNILVQQPTLNGDFETTQKITTVVNEKQGGTHEDTVVYRKSTNGDFYPWSRQVVDQDKKGAQVVDNTTKYVASDGGTLALASQEVRTTRKNPDGSENVTVDIYGLHVPGVAAPAGGGPVLKEVQEIERRPAGNQTVVETLSVRRPSVSNPNELGPLTTLSETVCKGKCQQ